MSAREREKGQWTREGNPNRCLLSGLFRSIFPPTNLLVGVASPAHPAAEVQVLLVAQQQRFEGGHVLDAFEVRRETVGHVLHQARGNRMVRGTAMSDQDGRDDKQLKQPNHH
jgi:hypothetical protein